MKRALIVCVVVCAFAASSMTQAADGRNEAYLAAARAGHVEAQVYVGANLGEGKNGFPKDPEKAVFWITKAAERGNPTAQLLLTNYYFYGFGVERDFQKARSWTEKAAAQGSEEGREILKLLDVVLANERFTEVALREEDQRQKAEQNPNAIPPSTAALKEYIQKMLEAAEEGDSALAKHMAGKFVLPNHDVWFKEVFGDTVGTRLSAGYAEQAGTLGEHFVESFDRLIEEAKDGITVTALRDPRDPRATGGQKKVMKVMKSPVALYSVRIGGIHYWSFVYADGMFRLAGKMYRQLEPPPIGSVES